MWIFFNIMQINFNFKLFFFFRWSQLHNNDDNDSLLYCDINVFIIVFINVFLGINTDPICW